MARVQDFLLLLLLLFAPNLHPVEAGPGTAGVFLLPEGGDYTLSFSAAGAACQQRNASVASRAQVERARQHGLETCKYGWTSDRIAVIPRLTADSKCGKGNTGVVPWATSEDRKFAVFCFDDSELSSAAPPRSTTDSSRLTSLPQTSTAAAAEPPLTSWTGPPPLRTSTAPGTPPTPASTLLLRAATSTVSPSTSTSGKASSTRRPTSASRPTASTAAGLSSAFSTSVQHNLSMFSTNAPTAPLAGLPTALIILACILMLLVVAAFFWCYRVSWPRRQPDNCIETEMWKQSDSDVDLGHAREEESERKSLGPEFRMTSE